MDVKRDVMIVNVKEYKSKIKIHIKMELVSSLKQKNVIRIMCANVILIIMKTVID
jgi:hypothetical protein